MQMAQQLTKYHSKSGLSRYAKGRNINFFALVVSRPFGCDVEGVEWGFFEGLYSELQLCDELCL